nr:MAG TPA: hypothetical protein [Caudoviricetes sp.]
MSLKNSLKQLIRIKSFIVQKKDSPLNQSLLMILYSY